MRGERPGGLRNKMAPRSMNDISGHLKSRIDWKAIVLSYYSKGGQKVPEEIKNAAIDSRSEAYRTAELLGINLNNYEGGR